MNVYVPIVGILYFLSFYVAVGSVLYFPLYRWQERFVSGDHSQWFPNNYATFAKGFLLCLVIWPVFLGYNIKTEIRYRKKGYL